MHFVGKKRQSKTGTLTLIFTNWPKQTFPLQKIPGELMNFFFVLLGKGCKS